MSLKAGTETSFVHSGDCDKRNGLMLENKQAPTTNYCCYIKILSCNVNACDFNRLVIEPIKKGKGN